MKILVVNCGSSSLKFQLIDSETEQVSASGLCERIGLDGSITYKKNGEKYQETIDLPNHGVALKKVLDSLLDEKIGVIKSLKEIDVCRSSFGTWWREVFFFRCDHRRGDQRN